MIQEKIRERGLKQTSAREKILELFLEKRAWTAGQINQRLCGVNRATVFRNLRTFEKNEVIQAIHSHESETAYELAGRTHHAHCVCPKCKTICCVPCPLKNIKKNHNLEFFNLCELCNK